MMHDAGSKYKTRKIITTKHTKKDKHKFQIKQNLFLTAEAQSTLRIFNVGFLCALCVSAGS